MNNDDEESTYVSSGWLCDRYIRLHYKNFSLSLSLVSFYQTPPRHSLKPNQPSLQPAYSSTTKKKKKKEKIP